MGVSGAADAETQEHTATGEPAVATGSSSSTAEAVDTATPASLEPLACVTCRSRKLKCDRLKPSCTRCTKNPEAGPCVYPESRRKPVFKRRNVKDLEARLAQVEDLLESGAIERKRAGEPFDANLLFTHDKSTIVPFAWGSDPYDVQPSDEPAAGPGTATGDSSHELMGLGLTEATPPFDVIEDLHSVYFEFQQTYVPIVHPARYLKAYHSAPHLRPPMGLQYIMWALSSQGHPKYNHCHDIFYRRARQYLEADEMRGHGEHFITIGHAQAWSLVATYEARRMFFTRAAMSCARCVRLVGIMGLNHVDDDETARPKSAPTLLPAKDWVELEERRRVFWSAFCLDSHASISTGWPNLINPTTITTRLPSSEESFYQGIQEHTNRLDDAFSSSSYSTFSNSIIICHIFNSILRHVQGKRGDRPEDHPNGPFWQRHRDLDTLLSSAFVFLPERYRLPRNLHDAVAVHANLNLHAATICLHNAALECATANKLSELIKKDCQSRLLIAAQEIVNIMKQTSHMATNYKTPLASLSLYCATAVFIHQAVIDEQRLQEQKLQPPDESSPESAEEVSMVDNTNLEFIFKRMDSLARNNNITSMFMQQAILDIHRNGLAKSGNLPWFEKYSRWSTTGTHYIPVLAMSAVSKYSDLQSPLPGRLPLDPSVENSPANDFQTPPSMESSLHQCCSMLSTRPCMSCQAQFARKARDADEAQRAREASARKEEESDNNHKKRRRIKSPGLVSDKPTTSARTAEAAPPAAVVLPHRVATPVASSLSAAPLSTTVTTVPPAAATTGQGDLRMPFLPPGGSPPGVFGLDGAAPLPAPPADQHQPQMHQYQPIGGGQPLSADMFANISIVDPWETSAPPTTLGGVADPTLTSTDFLDLGNATGMNMEYGNNTGLMMDASFMYSQLFGVARASGFNVPLSAAAAEAAAGQMTSDVANDPWSLLNNNEFEQ